MNTNRGIVYVSAGSPQYDAAVLRSILSLRRFYNGPVRIYTDKLTPLLLAAASWTSVTLVKTETVDTLEAMRSRHIKTRLGSLSPFKTTLFLDADTLVLSSLDDIWRFASAGDIAMALDWSDPTVKALAADLTLLSRDDAALVNDVQKTISTANTMPYYNSGVMVWRHSPQVLEMFRMWNLEWKKYKRLDQPPLCRVLNRLRKHGFGVIELPSRYNCRLFTRHTDDSRVVVFHSRLRRLAKDMQRLPRVKATMDYVLEAAGGLSIDLVPKEEEWLIIHNE